MAQQIDELCRAEGRNRSEFLREAVRHYLGSRAAGAMGAMAGAGLPMTTPLTPQAAPTQPAGPAPAPAQVAKSDGAALKAFEEWHAEADSVYDDLL